MTKENLKETGGKTILSFVLGAPMVALLSWLSLMAIENAKVNATQQIEINEVKAARHIMCELAIDLKAPNAKKACGVE